jgi:glutaredoxin
VAHLELYGTSGCPYTSELREWLEWKGKEFAEFDVEKDQEARRRMQALLPPPYAVPVLMEDGKVVQVGWQGRSCVVGGA